MELATPLLALAVFAATTIFSLTLFIVIVLFLPRDYFAERCWRAFSHKPSWIRAFTVAGKNLLGLLIIALGVVLSLPGIPGQGLFTILIGALLLDVPGKHRLIRWIPAHHSVLKGINRLRTAFYRPPLEIPAS